MVNCDCVSIAGKFMLVIARQQGSVRPLDRDQMMCDDHSCTLLLRVSKAFWISVFEMREVILELRSEYLFDGYRLVVRK